LPLVQRDYVGQSRESRGLCAGGRPAFWLAKLKYKLHIYMQIEAARRISGSPGVPTYE
jgi:hypothetical protein